MMPAWIPSQTYVGPPGCTYRIEQQHARTCQGGYRLRSPLSLVEEDRRVTLSGSNSSDGGGETR